MKASPDSELAEADIHRGLRQAGSLPASQEAEVENRTSPAHHPRKESHKSAAQRAHSHDSKKKGTSTRRERIDNSEDPVRSSGIKVSPEHPAGLKAKLKVLRRTTVELISGIEDLDLYEFVSQPPSVETGFDFYEEVSRFERALITRALIHTGGSQRSAAALLNLKPTTLHSKMKLLNIQPESLDFATDHAGK